MDIIVILVSVGVKQDIQVLHTPVIINNQNCT